MAMRQEGKQQECGEQVNKVFLGDNMSRPVKCC